MVRGFLRFVFSLVGWILLLGIVLAGVSTYALWRELARDLPPIDELVRYRPPAATLVYSDDGSLIGEFFDERRYPVELELVPEHVLQAFFAAEDSGFETHGGVDFVAIGRAFLANLREDRIVQGASTITQQVVKQLLLSPERSYERKLKEIILAQQLEEKLPKDKILELYLNEIYFGAGAYGLSAAAHTYFGVEVADLSIAQAALLAGLAKAPSRYNPLTKSDAAIARQKYVLRRMRTEGMISGAEYREARLERLTFAGRRIGTYTIAPWYLEHVRGLLEERFGESFASRGLRVHTAIDLDWQRSADEAMQQGLQRIEKRWRLPASLQRLPDDQVDGYLSRQRGARPLGGPQKAVVTEVVERGPQPGLRIRTPWREGFIASADLIAARGPVPPKNFRRGDVVSVDPLEGTWDGVASFALDRDPQVEGALVAVEPDTGLVKAMVGGADYERSKFNRAILARRQPGSAFKPFVFAAGIDRGFTPETILEDAPIELPNGARGVWTPKNFKDKYYGPVSLREALAKSLNSVTIRLALLVGVGPVRDYLDLFGFEARFPQNPSLVLGTSEVTPLELARAYGIFATGGRRFEPVFITSITDADGNAIEFPDSNARLLPVMEPQTARIMTDMLATVVESGTGRTARALERPAAGKTGTTNDSRDVWFVGFTPDVVASVWVGYDSSRPLGSRVTGGSAAAPIWTDFMGRVLADQPVREFVPPEPVVSPPQAIQAAGAVPPGFGAGPAPAGMPPGAPLDPGGVPPSTIPTAPGGRPHFPGIGPGRPYGPTPPGAVPYPPGAHPGIGPGRPYGATPPGAAPPPPRTRPDGTAPSPPDRDPPAQEAAPRAAIDGPNGNTVVTAYDRDPW